MVRLRKRNTANSTGKLEKRGDKKFRQSIAEALKIHNSGEEDEADWTEIAELAVTLSMAGVDEEDIPRILNVDPFEFLSHVNLKNIKNIVDGQVAKKIYTLALAGDEKMLQLIAKSHLKMHETKHVDVKSELSIRPVLNFSLLTKEEERAMKSLPAPDAEIIDVEAEEIGDEKF